MKKILILLSLLFCDTICADTITLKWFNEGISEYTTTTCQTGDDIILPQTTPTKRGHTFVGWKKAEYTPIEYIENVSGQNYIDTGIYANIDTHLLIKILNLAGTQGGQIFGSSSIGFFTWGTGDFFFRYGNSTTRRQLPSGIPSVLEQNKRESFVNGTSIGVLSNASFTQTKIYIFSQSAAPGAGISRIYQAKIWQNDILVRDFIPVLDSNGVACLYDKVSEQYFYDAAGNPFTAGPLI